MAEETTLLERLQDNFRSDSDWGSTSTKLYDFNYGQLHLPSNVAIGEIVGLAFSRNSNILPFDCLYTTERGEREMKHPDLRHRYQRLLNFVQDQRNVKSFAENSGEFFERLNSQGYDATSFVVGESGIGTLRRRIICYYP